jgi:hypothetical protein
MAATTRAKDADRGDPPYKPILRSFAFVHAVMAVLFAGCALLLIAVAARTGWSAIMAGLDRASSSSIIEAVGILAVAVVALQIAQTIAEEEVIRDSHISAPTRVRRFLSRFLVVIVVALAIEGLVAAVKAVHEDISGLAYAAALLVGASALLAGWGVFVRQNRYAEELEPEAMRAAKREDRKLE